MCLTCTSYSLLYEPILLLHLVKTLREEILKVCIRDLGRLCLLSLIYFLVRLFIQLLGNLEYSSSQDRGNCSFLSRNCIDIGLVFCEGPLSFIIICTSFRDYLHLSGLSRWWDGAFSFSDFSPFPLYRFLSFSILSFSPLFKNWLFRDQWLGFVFLLKSVIFQPVSSRGREHFE